MNAIQKFLKTKQAKIGIAAVCIVAVLAAAFFLQPVPNQAIASDTASLTSMQSGEAESAVSDNRTESAEDSSMSSDSSTGSTGSEEESAAPSSAQEESEGAGSSTPDTAVSSQAAAGGGASEQQQAQAASSTPAMEIDPDTGKDPYQTDPVPEGKPAPQEPENITVDESEQYTCTLSIRCDTILSNMDLFNQDKLSILPSDGVILAPTTVTFSEGESVFDVLKRVTREQRIQLEFESTPLYNSAYIEGINNLYEFDCGSLSGWMYRVNGWFPNYGCSRYVLQQGDVIEWVYTCDLGQDVGGGYATGQGAS